MTTDLNKGHKAYERDFGGMSKPPVDRHDFFPPETHRRQRCITIAGER